MVRCLSDPGLSHPSSYRRSRIPVNSPHLHSVLVLCEGGPEGGVRILRVRRETLRIPDPPDDSLRRHGCYVFSTIEGRSSETDVGK